MPNPTPIANLLDPDTVADKQTVMCVEGKLKSLFKVTKGNGSDGPYEFQNGILEDDTGEIKVSFCNNTQPPAARGQAIRIECFKSAQHGWVGVKIEDRGYQSRDGGWVEERQLKVTGTAVIEYPNGQPQGGGQPTERGYNQGQRGQKTPPPSRQQQPPKEPPMSNGTTNTTKAQLPHPRLILEDLAALHKDVFNIVNDTYEKEIKEGTVEAQALVSTIFIEAAKQGCVLDYKARAAKDLKKTYPPVPTDPNKWRECVLSSGEQAGLTLAQVSGPYLKKLFDYYDAKQDNSPLAECVYKAAHERGIIKPAEAEPATNEFANADIPF